MRKTSPGRFVAFTGVCAALYAIGAIITAYIVSPFGRGQFRPAVLIPALFAIAYGPEIGGLGAAIGTLMADSLKHGTLYIPSLLAAVPGNFIGFYLLGKILERKFCWSKFAVASQISLFVGNAVVAYLYTWVISSLGFLPPTLTSYELFLLGTSLMLWFFITEYPFVLLLGPPLLKILAGPIQELNERLKGPSDRPSWLVSLSLPGIVFLGISAIILLTPASSALLKGLLVKLSPSYAETTLSLIKIMFAGSGLALTMAGLLLHLGMGK